MPAGIYDHPPSGEGGMHSIPLPSDIGPSFVDLTVNYRIMARLTKLRDDLVERLGDEMEDVLE